MRVAQRLLHGLLLALTLVVGTGAAGLIVTQTAWFRNWLRSYIVVEAQQYLNGELSIDRLGGNLFFGVELENLAVSVDGEPIVAVKDLGLDYNVFELVSKGLSVDKLRLNKPVIKLVRTTDGWSLADVVKAQETEADRQGPGRPIAVEEIVVTDGTLVVEGASDDEGVHVPQRLEKIDGRMSFAYEPVRYTLEISQLALRTETPALSLNEFSGTVSVLDDTLFLDRFAMKTAESSVSFEGTVRRYSTRPEIQVRASSDKLSLPEAALFVPALENVALQPGFEIELDGPLDRLGVQLQARSAAGDLNLAGVVDANAFGAVKATVSLQGVNLAAIREDLPATAFTGKLSLDVQGAPLSDIESVKGLVAVSAPHVKYAQYVASDVQASARVNGRHVDIIKASTTAYGSRLSTRGRLVAGRSGNPQASIAYDLEGAARSIDLRRLPRELRAPQVDTDVSGTYVVRGVEPFSDGSVRRDVAGRVQFDESTVPGAQIGQGSVVNFTLRDASLSYDADATVAGLDPQRLGESFDVPALASERYKGTVNAHVVATGAGTSLDTLTLEGQGELTDTTILGAQLPQLSFEGRVQNRGVRVQLKGEFAALNPAVASGRPSFEGSIGGAVDASIAIADVSDGVVVDEVEAAGTLTLGASTVGGLTIDRATLDADWRGRSGEIRQLEIVGRDFNADAKGSLVLDESGMSDLAVSIDTNRLDEIGKVIDMPLAGIAHVKGKITGNRTTLQGTGVLTGDGLKYGNNGALSVTSDFSASISELDVERLELSNNTAATFVTIAGQNVNEVNAKTTYSGKQVAFTATAREPERTVDATGQLTLHPEHQEVHLDQFVLASRGLEWRLAQGTAPAIRYGDRRLTVDTVTLVSEAQEATATGVFGQPGDELKIALRNIDLAGVDTVLLREPLLSGRVDATMIVSGTMDAPTAEGQLLVTNGGFREYRYDALSASLKYGDGRIDLDARLDQNPTQGLTARGSVPASLVGGRSREPGAAAVSAPIDLTIDSTPIDLGFIQGLTNAVSDVKGTLEAHVKVGGSYDRPSPQGTFTIRDGALRVRATGGVYSGISGDVQLIDDRIRVPLITVLDNHSNPLSLTGELAIDERRVGNVQLYVSATDFKVIDNELGEVRVESALELVGDLGAPRLTGYLGVNSGRIRLDEIFAVTRGSAYPVEAADGDENESPQGPLSRLVADIYVVIPNDLIVSANSLQVEGSPLSLGSLSVTLGGNLQITKPAGASARVIGDVNTVRGTYQFQGRRFDILRDGAIRFAGLDELDPALDLRTRRTIQGVEAFVNVQGTLKMPEIVLTSTPPLESADILSLIVFNQPINELGLGEQMSLAERAQALTTGVVAGQLATSIGNALDLDVFEIDVAPASGGNPELIIGQQLGEKLYVRVQQALGDDFTNVILEYQLKEWMRLQTNMLQGSSHEQSLFRTAQGSGVDLIFFFTR
jgi:autotransporter translocation and assembly factor TamB